MKVKGLFPTLIAIVSGLIVLIGYLVRLPFLVEMSQTLLSWAVLLTAFAVLLGIFNLLIVHTRRLARKAKGSGYSLILILSMLATLAVGMIIPLFPAASRVLDIIFQTVILPVEASLMALLAVTLTYAGFRLWRHRMNFFTIVFLVTALLVLLGMVALPVLGNVPLISDTVRPILAQVFAAAGARGILIGVALGALLTGLRVLFGVDRPYWE
ncbi:MAG: hypothetical protein N2049_00820 [Anaerolineales bacterium]|nr:hypothetical protein [Anaerolineales bacterium]MCX7607747.1 hypothetical protein [Anaerolineales bacterium]MDW8226320.1 hypothetical protein [Anaerolineales bacterium]